MRRSIRENRSFRREASPALEQVADLPDYAQQMAQVGNQLDAFSKLGDTHVEEALTSMGDDVTAVGKASQALADLSGRLSNAEESQAFKEGMKQSAEASNGITVAFRQLADGMDAHSTALNEGVEELAEALSAVEEKARGL